MSSSTKDHQGTCPVLWDQNGGEVVWWRLTTRERGSQDYFLTPFLVLRRNSLWILQMPVGPRVSSKGWMRVGATVLLAQPPWGQDAHTHTYTMWYEDPSWKAAMGRAWQQVCSQWSYHLLHTMPTDSEPMRNRQSLHGQPRRRSLYLGYPSSLLPPPSSEGHVPGRETASLHSKPLETRESEAFRGDFKNHIQDLNFGMNSKES